MAKIYAAITFVHRHSTIGSLTFRLLQDKLSLVVRCSLPCGEESELLRGGAMKFIHVCYAALGFAVARWLFRREPVAMADPVARLRVSGLL